MTEFGGILSTPSLPSLPGPHWPGVVALDRVLSMGQIELNCVHIQNWIVWNKNVLTLNYVLVLNWIVRNRTGYMYKNGFGIK